MPAYVIAFPVQVSCPVCHKPCSNEDLSECYTCSGKMCRHCSECECDRLAAKLADLIPSAKLARTKD